MQLPQVWGNSKGRVALNCLRGEGYNSKTNGFNCKSCNSHGIYLKRADFIGEVEPGEEIRSVGKWFSSYAGHSSHQWMGGARHGYKVKHRLRVRKGSR